MRRYICLMISIILNAGGIIAAVEGLQGQYFDNKDLSGTPVLVRIDSTIDFDWGSGSPAAVLPSNEFSVRWTGHIQAPSTGEWQLVTNSDDGIRVWLGGRLVIDHWKGQSTTDRLAVPQHFQVGVRYPIRIEYYENTGSASMRLLWQQAVDAPAIIGGSELITDIDGTGVPGLNAEYYDTVDLSGDPALTRIDTSIDFNWGSGSPDPLVGPDTFGVRWSGYVQPTLTQPYRFEARTDDGVRLYVDGQLVIDEWNDHSAKAFTSPDLPLTGGAQVPVVMEYYENGGKSEARLKWAKGVVDRQVVASTLLWSDPIVLPSASARSPLTVEGVHTGALPTVTVGGSAVVVHALGDATWYANVPLAEDADVSVHVDDGLSSVTETIAWTPTALPQAVEVPVRRDDSLLFAADPASSITILTESGVAAGPLTVPASGLLPCAFPNSGYFTVQVDDGAGNQSSVDVVVASVDLVAQRFVSAVNYSRAYVLPVAPTPELVTWHAMGPIEVGASNDVMAGSVDLSTRVINRGEPVILARLGVNGQLLAHAEVEEFTFTASGRTGGIVTYEDPVDHRSVTMRPFLPDVWFQFKMFAGQCTFEGGLPEMSINTSGAAIEPVGLPPVGAGSFVVEQDPVTGESIGVYDYIVEVTDGKACHRVFVGVVNSPWVEIGTPDTENPHYCNIRTYHSLILPFEDSPDDEGGSEDWSNPELLIASTEADDEDCSYEVSAPFNSYEFKTPQPCDAECAVGVTVIDIVDEPGKYPKTVRGLDCEGEGESGFYVTARIDAHGTASGTSDEITGLAENLVPREGTILDPVIVMVSGGTGDVQGCSLYGTISPPQNTWTLKALAKDPITDQNLPAGTTIQWSGVGSASGSTSESITFTYDSPGRYFPRLDVYYTDPEDPAAPTIHRVAEIHSIALENRICDDLPPKNAPIQETAPDLDAPVRTGLPFDLSNKNGGNGYGVDVRVGTEGSGDIRGRISLDGYPQNEYWVTDGDTGDLPQVLLMPESDGETIYAQGYRTPSASKGDIGIKVAGQAKREVCVSPQGCLFEGTPVTVGWESTDEESFTSLRVEWVIPDSFQDGQPVPGAGKRVTNMLVNSDGQSEVVLDDVSAYQVTTGAGYIEVPISGTITLPFANNIPRGQASDVESVSVYIDQELAASGVPVTSVESGQTGFWSQHPYSGSFDAGVAVASLPSLSDYTAGDFYDLMCTVSTNGGDGSAQGWDNISINLAVSQIPGSQNSGSGNATMSIAFEAGLSAGVIDSARHYFGDRSPTSSDPLFTEDQAQPALTAGVELEGTVPGSAELRWVDGTSVTFSSAPSATSVDALQLFFRNASYDLIESGQETNIYSSELGDVTVMWSGGFDPQAIDSGVMTVTFDFGVGQGPLAVAYDMEETAVASLAFDSSRSEGLVDDGSGAFIGNGNDVGNIAVTVSDPTLQAMTLLADFDAPGLFGTVTAVNMTLNATGYYEPVPSIAPAIDNIFYGVIDGVDVVIMIESGFSLTSAVDSFTATMGYGHSENGSARVQRVFTETGAETNIFTSSLTFDEVGSDGAALQWVVVSTGNDAGAVSGTVVPHTIRVNHIDGVVYDGTLEVFGENSGALGTLQVGSQDQEGWHYIEGGSDGFFWMRTNDDGTFTIFWVDSAGVLQQATVTKQDYVAKYNQQTGLAIRGRVLRPLSIYLAQVISVDEQPVWNADDHIIYINEEAEMPDLRAQALINAEQAAVFTNAQVSWMVEIVYDREERSDTFPPAGTAPVVKGFAEQWKLLDVMGDQVRGGRGTLTATIPNVVNNQDIVLRRVFHIRGMNPTVAMVQQYMNQQGAPWYVLPVAVHESATEGNPIGPDTRMKHFNYARPPAMPGPIPDYNAKGGYVLTPNRSPDEGYGIMQLTNPVPGPQELWNWKENVDAGLTLAQEKRQTASQFLNQQIAAAGGVQIPSQVIGGVTFAQNPQQGEFSILDASTVKLYNGAWSWDDAVGGTVGNHHYAEWNGAAWEFYPLNAFRDFKTKKPVRNAYIEKIVKTYLQLNP